MQNSDRYLEELCEWLSIPSISGDPTYAPQIAEAANWISSKLEKIGFDTKRVETGHNPIVFASYTAAGPDKPTIMIYGHYDVQSPEPLAEWESDPFKPEIRDGKIYARGSADDKGQFYAWIAGLDQIYRTNGAYPCNIKIVVEGAEEEGSIGFSTFLEEYKSDLAADVCFISDSHSLSPRQPLITYGLRGLAYFEISLETAAQDAHSGIYGGNIANAITELSRLLCRIKDDREQITIPGFYDDVRALSDEEVSELEAFPWTQKDMQAEIGIKNIVGESGFSIAARAGARPTFDVHGIWGGYTGDGGKTIIPAKATAKVSMRLVPNQTPEKISAAFISYLETITPEYGTLTCTPLETAHPVLIDRSTPFFKTAEAVMEETFGNKPVYELSGGSIGVVTDIKEILGIDSVLLGFGLPDDGLHAPNEKLDVEMFEKGILTVQKLLQKIGT